MSLLCGAVLPVRTLQLNASIDFPLLVGTPQMGPLTYPICSARSPQALPVCHTTVLCAGDRGTGLYPPGSGSPRGAPSSLSALAHSGHSQHPVNR